jgi:hypothetical protein
LLPCQEADDAVGPQGRCRNGVEAGEADAVETQQAVEAGDPEPAVGGPDDVGQVVDREAVGDRPLLVDEAGRRRPGRAGGGQEQGGERRKAARSSQDLLVLQTSLLRLRPRVCS